MNADIPIYVQLISGTILGVALGNLLGGSVKFVQQPLTHRFNILHGLWIVFILGSTFVFWWQEALTFSNVAWTFPLYLFQIAYCSTYLFMTAMLLPDSVEAYGTHYDYFIARRQWFYGALILALLLDIGNVAIKTGMEEVANDPSFLVASAVAIALLIWAMATPRRWVQVTVAIIFVLLTLASMLAE